MIKLCLLTLLWSPALATSNESTWYVDDDAVGVSDGSSWADAFSDLQDALAVAQAGDEIRVAQGAYRPDRGTKDPLATFRLISGTALRGGYAGFGAEDPDERDVSAFETILSGTYEGENSYHVVTGSNTDATTLLEGVTITGGRADRNVDPDRLGGGFYATGAELTIAQCEFRGNYARADRGSGGGMYVEDGDPKLVDCRFFGNEGAVGGGIKIEHSSATLTRCVFVENSALVGGGLHAFRSEASQHVRLEQCEFRLNEARIAGGGGVISLVRDSRTEFVDCVFERNTVTGPSSSGGALFAQSGLTITRCSFLNNLATGAGGAVQVESGPSAFVDCTFVDNVSNEWGGAVDATGSSFEGCTFLNNTALDRGGALVMGNGPLIDCHFQGNAVVDPEGFGQGGAVEVRGSNAIIRRSTFINNFAFESYGAILVDADHHVTLVDCQILGNEAVNLNGGIGGGSQQWIRCIIAGNVAHSTGAASGEINATCSVIVGNLGRGRHGAVQTLRQSSLVNCVVVSNRGTDGTGGVLVSSGELRVANSVLWDNTGTTGDVESDQLQIIGGTVAVDHSCIEGLDVYQGNGNIGDHPGFVRMPDPGPDGEWGTEDDDYGDLRLAGDSPGIDSGDSGAVPFDVLIDLGGNTRLVDEPATQDTGAGGCPIVDMGVYEVQAEGGCCLRDPRWQCDGDVDGDGQVNPVDSGLVQAAFGSGDEQDLCNYDTDCDGQINPVDSGLVQSLFGTCQAPRNACP